MSTPSYPVRLVGGHELGRSRLTVFFRIFLLIPHWVVLALYGIAETPENWERLVAAYLSRLPERLRSAYVALAAMRNQLIAAGWPARAIDVRLQPGTTRAASGVRVFITTVPAEPTLESNS